MRPPSGEMDGLESYCVEEITFFGGAARREVEAPDVGVLEKLRVDHACGRRARTPGRTRSRSPSGHASGAPPETGTRHKRIIAPRGRRRIRSSGRPVPTSAPGCTGCRCVTRARLAALHRDDVDVVHAARDRADERRATCRPARTPGAMSPMMFSGGRVTCVLAAVRDADQHDAERRAGRVLSEAASHCPSGDQSRCRPTDFDARRKDVRDLAVDRRRRPATTKIAVSLGPVRSQAIRDAVGRPCRAEIVGRVGGEPERLRAADRLHVDIGVLAGFAGRRVDDLLSVGREGRLELAAGSCW